jgi:hypothetical protein
MCVALNEGVGCLYLLAGFLPRVLSLPSLLQKESSVSACFSARVALLLLLLVLQMRLTCIGGEVREEPLHTEQQC